MGNSLALTNIERQASALLALKPVVASAEYEAIVQDVLETARKEYRARVIITGVGKNANIAAKISETMASLGIPSLYLNTAHTGHGDYGHIGHEDLIIHISRSGTTREMLETIQHVTVIRPNVKQILIHCKPTKPRNPHVHRELCIGAVVEGDEHGLAPTTSTTALLCILDCIAVQVSHGLNFQRMDFLKLHPDGALGAMLKAESGVA
jgi:arabinose-5-phosphate isomerase